MGERVEDKVAALERELGDLRARIAALRGDPAVRRLADLDGAASKAKDAH